MDTGLVLQSDAESENNGVFDGGTRSGVFTGGMFCSRAWMRRSRARTRRSRAGTLCSRGWLNGTGGWLHGSKRAMVCFDGGIGRSAVLRTNPIASILPIVYKT